MSQQISKRRIAGAALALVMGALAFYFAVEALRQARQFDEWLVAEPARFTADLSRAGTMDVPFVQTCQTAHGQSLSLNVTGAAEPAAALLAGLRGKAEVIAGGGRTVIAVEFPQPLPVTSPAAEEVLAPEEGIALAFFHPFETGNYTLRMHVIDPAPALAGLPQVVVARYQLCGLEQMPAVITGAFSIVAGVPALILAGYTAMGLRRHGWRRGTP